MPRKTSSFTPAQTASNQLSYLKVINNNAHRVEVNGLAFAANTEYALEEKLAIEVEKASRGQLILLGPIEVSAIDLDQQAAINEESILIVELASNDQEPEGTVAQ